MRGAMFAVCLVLAACGGGDQAPQLEEQTPVTQSPSPSVTSAPLQPTAVPTHVSEVLGIAAWGDSLTVDYSGVLCQLEAPRPVFQGGRGGQTSAQIADRFMDDTQHRSWVTVLWLGRNNFSNTAQVMADLARVTSALSAVGNDKFLVMSIPNMAHEVRGSSSYISIQKLNAAIAATYPQQFVDIRSGLVESYDPQNPQDVIDHGNDVPPSSLRRDALHMNDAGRLVLAKLVRQALSEHGLYLFSQPPTAGNRNEG